MNLHDPEPSQSDDAARAGWLYYVGGMTQDQIARELGVSRQRAQRLVSRAVADGRIHVRLEHPIAACLDLERALVERFGLSRARVAPSLGAGADAVRSIAPAAAQDVTGAGASFPAPVYAKWADAYNKATGVRINYQSVGSGAGIRQIKGKTVDFGASDMPLKDEDLAQKNQIALVLG